MNNFQTKHHPFPLQSTCNIEHPCSTIVAIDQNLAVILPWHGLHAVPSVSGTLDGPTMTSLGDVVVLNSTLCSATGVVGTASERESNANTSGLVFLF